jgi:thiamine transport system ATP-binding protein
MLRAEGLVVRFGPVPALDGVDLAVDRGERLAVLGASGSGKTTLLRAVAGLQPIDGGRVLIEDRDVTAVPPHRRGVGLMFQDGLLFAHLSVVDNVAYGLRRQGRSPRDARAQAADWLDRVGLGPERFADRPVTDLSGGEQQRVALARTLAPEPSLLLLDEPFASLDPVLRGRLADDVRGIAERHGTTVVTVTHDAAEAFAFADRVAVMAHGRVVQTGTVAELRERPASGFVAVLVGLQVMDAAPLSLGGGEVAVPGSALRLRASGGAGALPGVVVQRVVAADAIRVVVAVGDGIGDGMGGGDAGGGRRLLVEVPPESVPRPGQAVHVAVDLDAAVRVGLGAD